MNYITIRQRTDGFGAQYQNAIYGILYAEAHGFGYVHVPFRHVEHNYDNDPKFREKIEELMNLRDYYNGDGKSASPVDNEVIYEDVERNIDKYTSGEAMANIKRLYWENKEHPLREYIHVAVHVRRPNSRDVRVEGTNTPDSYYLYMMDRIKKKYAGKNIIFNVYSQGVPEQFRLFELRRDTVLHLNEGVHDTFHALVDADILVTSASSLSYTAALLTDGEVYYHPFWHRPKKSWKVLFDFEEKKRKKLEVPLLMCTMKMALSCDYIICGRFDDTHEICERVIDEDRLKGLKTGQKLFINGTRIEEFVDTITGILEQTRVKLSAILIGNIEPHCDYGSVMKLLPYADHIYVANNNISHPQIHVLPIGMRDPQEVHATHKHFTHRTMFEVLRYNFDREYLCLLCFRLEDSSSQNRKDCYRILNEKEWVTDLLKSEWPEQPVAQCGKVPVQTHYEYILRSKYALCPTGYGFDVHKFWECLYLKCIPVVVRTHTPFDKLYEAFPCLILERWEDLTEEMMNENYDRLYSRIATLDVNAMLKMIP